VGETRLDDVYKVETGSEKEEARNSSVKEKGIQAPLE